MYNNIKKLKNTVRKLQPIININFIDGAFVELKNFEDDVDYEVNFFSKSNLVYTTTLKNNMWAKASRQYYTDWRVVVKDCNGEIIHEYSLDLTGKNVLISLESKSLGDTMAWFPYAEEFRKKMKCNVYISTFMNDLFIEQYPKLKFVNPGQPVSNLTASYKIGWFFDVSGGIDYSRCPINFREYSLQQTATSILGLDYQEVRPILKLNDKEKKNKVGIGIHSTAQSKYWNNPTGWQEVVDYLNQKGYEVVLYSKEGDGYMGNFQPNGVSKFSGTLQEVIDDLSECQFFIGLGSGLSWLAWSVGLPVVLISGFSEDWAETFHNTYRVINKNVCHGCFNKYKFDPGDWNWCPVHKGTDKQFECTKSITSEMVIDEINKIIN